jgi:CBS domain-containing protein
MKLSEIMTAEVEVIGPDANLQQAAQRMKALDVGLIPICDGERLVGTLTDRDITVRATAEGRDPRRTPVRDAMSSEVIYCYADQDVEEGAKVMRERQVRRLPILDRDKRLVGIVSLGDLAVRLSSVPLSGKTLEGVSEPTQTQSQR